LLPRLRLHRLSARKSSPRLPSAFASTKAQGAYDVAFVISCGDFEYHSSDLAAVAGWSTSVAAPAKLATFKIPNALLAEEVHVVFYRTTARVQHESFQWSTRFQRLISGASVGKTFGGKIKADFGFWFHTAFVQDDTLKLRKHELDRACKDRRHVKFHEHFAVELLFNSRTPDEIAP